MQIGTRENAPFAVFARFERVENPARGRNGGSDGAAGVVRIASGKRQAKGTHVLQPGERLIVEMPGGGGFGDRGERELDDIQADLINGYVTATSAASTYNVALGSSGALDIEATRAKRRHNLK